MDEIVERPVHAVVTPDAGGYGSIPMLKPPTWEWHIAVYFFLGGASAGSFLFASLAELFGHGRFSAFSRNGYRAAFAAFLPCPGLLIADLGRPERFLHMLRVFKPSSPMNLGSWTLAVYSLVLARKALGGRSRAGALSVLGSGLAVTMCSYPGVLLGTTSNPLWSSGRLLGGLLASSSLHSGAALAQLVHSAAGSADPSTRILHRVERLAAVCQGILAVLFVIESGTAARPLLRGRHASTFWLGAIAPMLLPAGVRRSKRGKSGRSVLLPLLALAGGLALKWAVTHAGREAVKKGDGALIPG